MKSALIAAAVLLGSSEAAVHTMKLKKIPLEEQLVRVQSPTNAICYALSAIRR
jgi:hypothetical protein